jgi:hypothetical protein
MPPFAQVGPVGTVVVLVLVVVLVVVGSHIASPRSRQARITA